MTRKKKHHFNPVFYLNGFVDPDNEPFLWVYRKESPDDPLKLRPKSCGFQKDYYSFVNPKGKKDSETFENIFEKLESDAAPVFAKVRNAEVLEEVEKAMLSWFLAFSMTRVPAWRKAFEETMAFAAKHITMTVGSSLEALKASLEEFMSETGKEMQISAEQLREFILSEETRIEVSSQASLYAMRLAIDFAPILFRMKWVLMQAPGELRFLTSDNPVYVWSPSFDPNSPFGVGLANKDTQVSFPIAREMALFATWSGEEGFAKARIKGIREVNKRTTIGADRFIYSSQRYDGLSKLVQKYKDYSAGFEPYLVEEPKDPTNPFKTIGVRFNPRARKKPS